MKDQLEAGSLKPNSSLNLSALGERKSHPAIEYFRRLQKAAPSIQLAAFLSSFTEPKLIDPETFTEGVKKFIQLANSNPLDQKSSQGRETFYGNSYSGLHYKNDLAKLWNAAHSNDEPIKALDVAALSPSKWDSVRQDGFFTLIYKGQQPAQALDELVKGPTVIDCGMFTQLSLWFGLRYMLGNERFNHCFGRTPFFITQGVYQRIEDSNKPFAGNPLYSFLAKKEIATISSVTVKHLSNTPLYRVKHPGGHYGGANCIVIGDQYYIFDPHLESAQGITKSRVLNLLRDVFNEAWQPYDIDHLSLYAQTPEAFHPMFLLTYGQLNEEAQKLRDKTLSEEEFSHVEQSPELELTFDLHQFLIWLQRVENTLQPDSIDYSPQPIDHSLMPKELLDSIPFENRTSMDFSKFKQQSQQQNELMRISKQFCQSIMIDESKLVILTGKAGVGKTASAVCALKELTARGKKVVWISEVMVNGWAEQTKNLADLDNCRLEIDALLASDPDVVFLDDDNLAGFSGNLLLEKIYSWFVSHPRKGLFITSNEPIRFNDCYGYELDEKYHYPPFNDYTSPQYLNWQHKADLAGESLRCKREGQSIGAIVSNFSWKANESKLREVELIPAFDDSEELAPFRQQIRQQDFMTCDAYHKLRPVQQKWIRVHEIDSFYIDEDYYVEAHLTVIPSKFQKTTCKTIALEIGENSFIFFGKQIDSNSMDQLIRVLNYAHDQGGRRIILINQTSFSNEQLLMQIKQQLPQSERERTWSRLMLLLCETEYSIFTYDEFNGHIEIVPPKSDLPHKGSHDSNGLSIISKIKATFFSEDNSEHIEPLKSEENVQQGSTKPL